MANNTITTILFNYEDKMPAKKKASEPIETPVITQVNTKTTKAKGQVIELNDDDTRVVTTAVTKAVKGKASTKVVPTAKPETKATPTKTQPQAPKVPKEKLPRPVTVGRLELAAEVAKAVSEHMEITGVEADAIVSEIIHSMIDGLKEGNKIEIRGFGAFRLRSRRARVGRNPKTGAKVEVPSKSVVYFKLGKELKETLLTHTETNKASTSKPLASLPAAEPAKAVKATKPAKATKQK
jgi:integration host factor subunit beta